MPGNNPKSHRDGLEAITFCRHRQPPFRPFVSAAVSAAIRCRLSPVRTSAGSSQRPLPLYRPDFPRRSPELDERSLKPLDSPFADLRIRPSDRLGFEICYSLSTGQASDRWDSPGNAPVTGDHLGYERSVLWQWGLAGDHRLLEHEASPGSTWGPSELAGSTWGLGCRLGHGM
ncbi:hypothetical protein V6N13_049494 [Hibiscus sabdariffa]